MVKKELVCPEGHALKTHSLFPPDDRPILSEYRINGSQEQENILKRSVRQCCIESIRKLATLEDVFLDIKKKWVPLMQKWMKEEREVLKMCMQLQEGDTVLLSLQNIAKEFKPWIYKKMDETGHVEDMLVFFKMFFTAKTETVKLKKLLNKEDALANKSGPYPGVDVNTDLTRARNCFSPALVCHNCESRGVSHKPKVSCARGSECVHQEKMKRCSACHIVAYCSEKCQKEHWIINHKNMCKILSGKKKLGSSKHDVGSGTDWNCRVCLNLKDKLLVELAGDSIDIDPFDSNSPLVPCSVEQMQVYLMAHYWHSFGYHNSTSCGCDNDMVNLQRESIQYPMQCPFIMGEMSEKYLGWIDQKLSVLSVFISTIKLKFHEETEGLGIGDELGRLFKYLLMSRASYWYFATNEKRRYMTDVLFAQKMIELSHFLAKEDTGTLFLIDEGFKKLDTKKNIWWETFLHHMADFYRRLRWTHFQMYKNDFPNHRADEFAVLRVFKEYAMSQLSRPVELLLPTQLEKPLVKSKMITESFLITLPAGSECFSCNKDLSNLQAAWQLQGPIKQALWVVISEGGTISDETVESLVLFRYKGQPLIFEDRDWPGSEEDGFKFLSCGTQKQCTMKMVVTTITYFDKLARIAINWVFNTQKCSGCLKFCYESHRCSGCRSVRYCSKDCLLEDWNAHEDRCKELAKLPQQSVNVRKLEGEKRQQFYDECLSWLSMTDPYFVFFATRWKSKGLGIDEIITSPVKKSKQKKPKEEKVNGKNGKEPKTISNGISPKQTNTSVEPFEVNKKGGVEPGEMEYEKVESNIQGENVTVQTEPVDEDFYKQLKQELRNAQDAEAKNLPSVQASEVREAEPSVEDKIMKSLIKSFEGQGVEITVKASFSIPTSAMSPSLEKAFDEMKKRSFSDFEAEIEEVVNESENMVDPCQKAGEKKKPCETMTNNKEEIKQESCVSSEGDKKLATILSDKDESDVDMEKLRTWMERLPEEARRRLYELRYDKDPDADLTPQEYRDMLEVVKPYLPEDANLYDPDLEEKIMKMIPDGNTKIEKEKSEEMETIATLIKRFRRDLKGKHYEIRHIKANPWMNTRICKIEDVTINKSVFDQRVVCSIKGDEAGKQYSLKLSNMVDICADLDDIVGTLCKQGNTFKESNMMICNGTISKFLGDAVEWFGKQGLRRAHQLYRLKKIEDSNLGQTKSLKCMDFPDESEMDETCHVSATLAAIRPGCIGNNRVEFAMFGQLICGCPDEEQMRARFREYLVSGMCHACQVRSLRAIFLECFSIQIYYLEMKMPERIDRENFIGTMFSSLSRTEGAPVFFGPHSRKCQELGIETDRFYIFCKLVSACFTKGASSNRRQTIKSLRAFVKAGEETEQVTCVTKAQFDACLEMMKEAGLVKQVGNSLLLVKTFGVINSR